MESFLAGLDSLLLYVFAFSALIGSILVVTLRQPMRVATALISTMIFLGGVYGLLGVHFIAAFQVLIYVGAVMVFMVYVIMLLDVRDPSFLERYGRAVVPSVALAGLLALAGCSKSDDDSADTAAASEPPRIDLTLEITAATRSVMMFTVEYRLTIANRSDRAVTDVSAAVQLACARASAGNASPGAAQSLAGIARVGPHQARSVTGTVQLPLSAIAPLRQGSSPLFIPLAHVTLEGEGLRAMTRSFVIGTPSSAGRVHPIPLDQPPGAIAGLVAQAIAIPPVSAGV